MRSENASWLALKNTWLAARTGRPLSRAWLIMVGRTFPFYEVRPHPQQLGRCRKNDQAISDLGRCRGARRRAARLLSLSLHILRLHPSHHGPSPSNTSFRCEVLSVRPGLPGRR